MAASLGLPTSSNQPPLLVRQSTASPDVARTTAAVLSAATNQGAQLSAAAVHTRSALDQAANRLAARAAARASAASRANGTGRAPLSALLNPPPVVPLCSQASSAPLLNVDFCDSGQTKTGFAAVGQNAAELEKVVGELLCDPARCQELGRNAQRVVLANQGPIERTVEMIIQHLPQDEIYVAPRPGEVRD